ncbi:MAG: hypothetical protein RLZZ196_1861 [Bacteroidota bacterium]|jgi:hypothetical protein
MAYLSVSREEKEIALNAAKVEFERDLYKTVIRLGLDPDTFDLTTFQFDEESMSEEEIASPDFKIKQHIDMIISRLNIINSKIAEL